MKVVTDRQDPAGKASDFLATLFQQHKHHPVLLLLSGGSAFRLLENLPESVFPYDLTIAMLDERASSDPAVNNGAQLMTTGFYARAVAGGATVFDSRPRLGEPAAGLASRYEDFLRTWYSSHSDGITIATLGMGADGHTAGIFPGFVATLDQGRKWVEACTLPAEVNPHRERVTVTPTFLATKINHAVAYVVGPDKRAVLTILKSDTDPEVVPAALWYRMSQVTVFTDS